MEHTMEHRWGSRIAADFRTCLRHDGQPPALGVMLELSLSGALIRTELLGEDFTGLEVQLGELWIPAAVVRHVPGALAIEWLQFAPEAVSEALDGLRGLSTQLGAAAA